VNDCLFCKIIRGEIPSHRLAENAECIAFRDISPQAPVHVLVIPKLHYDSLATVPDAGVVGAMSMMAQQVARDQGLDKSGYRVVINTGADGGQTVGHIHLHLLGGRTLKWPPG